MASPNRLSKTLSIQTDRKIANQSREDIVKAVFSSFSSLGVVAIQIGYDVIRVSFATDEGYKRAMEKDGICTFLHLLQDSWGWTTHHDGPCFLLPL